jgi:hypothetical protein
MEHRTFWDEELRAFPHGGRGAAVWVVRRDGAEPGAPLRLLLAWDSGQARRDGLAARPPLGALLRAMGDDREELIRKSREVALWVEPLRQGGQVVGCLGIWMDAAEAWREGIFLWGQRLVPRLLPVLGVLETQGPVPGETLNQPTLFPLAPLYVPGWRRSRPAVARPGPLAPVADPVRSPASRAKAAGPCCRCRGRSPSRAFPAAWASAPKWPGSGSAWPISPAAGSMCCCTARAAPARRSSPGPCT